RVNREPRNHVVVQQNDRRRHRCASLVRSTSLTSLRPRAMQIFDLIQANPLIWILFIVYLVATSALAWMGHKKTSDLESFAVGKGDMNPVVVGITLASSIASSA